MPTPVFEIRWGSHNNPTEGLYSISDLAQRNALRPMIRSVINMVTEGLDEFGVEVSDRKRVVVHAVKSRFTALPMLLQAKQ